MRGWTRRLRENLQLRGCRPMSCGTGGTTTRPEQTSEVARTRAPDVEPRL